MDQHTAIYPPVHSSQALDDIMLERYRQISAEGWTLRHDDEHDEGALAKASIAYVSHASVALALRSNLKPGENLTDAAYQSSPPPKYWPWDRKWWKPKDPRRDLVKAGALIVAEIERLDRAASVQTL